MLSTPAKTLWPNIFVKGPPVRKKYAMEPERMEMNTGTFRNSSTSSTTVDIKIILVSIIYTSSPFPVKSLYVFRHICTAMVRHPMGSGA